MARRDSASAVDEVADELYALAPDRFTDARKDAVSRAREAGDADLATKIGKLRKPSIVGWLANQLVRAHQDEVTALLELGDALREATATLDSDQLRALGGQQRQVVTALVRQAGALATAAGQRMSDATARGLEETLHAALADATAADQLATGRLTGALASSGFPGLGAGGGQPAPSAAPRADNRQSSGDAGQRLARARADEDEARAAAQRAADDLERAGAAVTGADKTERTARRRADDLRRQLAEAESALSDAQAAVRAAKSANTEATRAAQRARRALDTASERVSRLEQRQRD